MRGPLVARYYYIYAVDYDRNGEWSGQAYMCSRDKEFTIRGTRTASRAALIGLVSSRLTPASSRHGQCNSRNPPKPRRSSRCSRAFPSFRRSGQGAHQRSHPEARN